MSIAQTLRTRPRGERGVVLLDALNGAWLGGVVLTSLLVFVALAIPTGNGTDAGTQDRGNALSASNRIVRAVEGGTPVLVERDRLIVDVPLDNGTTYREEFFVDTEGDLYSARTAYPANAVPAFDPAAGFVADAIVARDVAVDGPTFVDDVVGVEINFPEWSTYASVR